jgi:hypothetical protein
VFVSQHKSAYVSIREVSESVALFLCTQPVTNSLNSGMQAEAYTRVAPTAQPYPLTTEPRLGMYELAFTIHTYPLTTALGRPEGLQAILRGAWRNCVRMYKIGMYELCPPRAPQDGLKAFRPP